MKKSIKLSDYITMDAIAGKDDQPCDYEGCKNKSRVMIAAADGSYVHSCYEHLEDLQKQYFTFDG